MEEYTYDIPFPKEQKKLLLQLVSQAQKCNVLSMRYYLHQTDDLLYNLSFFVDTRNTIGHNIFLTPRLFKWADYEKKTRLGKWWVRLPDVIRDIMIAFSFIVSLILTMLQILKIFKILP